MIFQKTIIASITVFFWFSSTYACDYYDQMLECESAVSQSTNEEFLCVESDNSNDILYNLILDDKFKSIDAQAIDFLEWTETEKWYFFWEDAVSTYFQWVELVWLKFGKWGEYWREYYNVCDAANPEGILQTTLACYKEENNGESMTISVSAPFFTDWVCMQLAETKLVQYEWIGYDILKANKAQIRSDTRKTFQQDQRSKYQVVLDYMRINISYMERIWKKWSVKTKNVYK